MIVTFDLFSALIDSRTGGAAVFAGLAREHDWTCTGAELYDAWDAANKAGQLRAAQDVATGEGAWRSFRELSTRALASAYAELGLDADADSDYQVVAASIGDWPLWPDVVTGVAALRDEHTLGILSNVDDDLYASTRAAALFDDDLVLTSQRLRAYKPGADIYHRAARLTGGHLHVASSARDVRGALESGLPTVRLVRPGHTLDPDGPQPQHVVRSLDELTDVLPRLG